MILKLHEGSRTSLRGNGLESKDFAVHEALEALKDWTALTTTDCLEMKKSSGGGKMEGKQR